MSKLIFNLKSVPHDEADDVRNLLTDNKIEFFESPAGNWGVSVHALWSHDEAQSIEAKQLISDYQIKRSELLKIEIQEKKDNGELETLFQRILSRPVQFVGLAAIIFLILYVSIMPFLGIGKV